MYRSSYIPYECRRFFVDYDTSDGYDHEEVFSTLAGAVRFYNEIKISDRVYYKKLSTDTYSDGTLTLLNSKGENNLRKYGFLPCDYNCQPIIHT